ncbi:MAG: ABC transporter substrate-binding protein [Gammaproteobacteria bacterium]|nr:ABC transporter substrate-binding protein [Gammaproteobacteria bacterium]
MRILVAFTLSCLICVGARADTPAARAVIEKLEMGLISVMAQADALGFEGRYQMLVPLLSDNFDLAYVSELVLRRAWSELTDQQRSDFATRLKELTASTYAGELAQLTDEKFVVTEARALKRGRVLVRSELRTSDSVEQFDYVLHRVGDAWRIINVSVNGVSDLALKRAEYARLIESGGFDGLMAQIETQIDEYRAAK